MKNKTLINKLTRGLSFMVSFLAPSFILLLPVVNAASYYQYSFLSPEILAILAIVFGLGLCTSIIISLGRTKKLFVTIVISILLTFSLVIQLDPSIYNALNIFMLSLLICYFLGENALIILGFSTGIMLISSFFVTKDDKIMYTAKHAAQNLPPFIHIILDEHIGINGITQNLPEGRELKKELVNFYQKYGFSVYENAYSHYNKTINSLTAEFNFNTADFDYYHNDFYNFMAKKKHRVKASYLDKLQDLGYNLSIYQSDYLDFCHEVAARSSCTTYPVVNLKLIEKSSLPFYVKIENLLAVLIRQSTVISSGYRLLTNFFGIDYLRYLVSPNVNISALDSISNEASSNNKGVAYIAHVFAPHYPYQYDENCELVHEVIDYQLPRGIINNEKAQVRRQKNYFKQVRCVYKKLEQLLGSLQNSGILANSIVIIQGDHGSRISANSLILKDNLSNLADITSDEITNHYSTLYAVKMPNYNLLANNDLLPLEVLLAQSLNQALHTNIKVPKDFPFIYLRTNSSRLYKLYIKNNSFLNSDLAM